MDHKIVHLEIPAEDPDRAAKFYNDLFGWGIAQANMEGVEYWLGQTNQGEGAVGIGMMRRQAPGQSITNYIAVDSVDAFVARATELGATLVVPKMEVTGMGWFAQFSDPEGNMFAIWENNPHSGHGG